MALKILLADDSMVAQNMGKKILTEAGYNVTTVSNGAAAVKKLPEVNPDIVVLDVYMPGYNGLEVCERVKNNPETARVPVLLTVGKLEPFRPEDGMRVKADGVIIKPFEATDLIAVVAKLAERVHAEVPAAPAEPETIVYEEPVQAPAPAPMEVPAGMAASPALIDDLLDSRAAVEVPVLSPVEAPPDIAPAIVNSVAADTPAATEFEIAVPVVESAADMTYEAAEPMVAVPQIEAAVPEIEVADAPPEFVITMPVAAEEPVEFTPEPTAFTPEPAAEEAVVFEVAPAESEAEVGTALPVETEPDAFEQATPAKVETFEIQLEPMPVDPEADAFVDAPEVASASAWSMEGSESSTPASEAVAPDAVTAAEADEPVAEPLAVSGASESLPEIVFEMPPAADEPLEISVFDSMLDSPAKHQQSDAQVNAALAAFELASETIEPRPVPVAFGNVQETVSTPVEAPAMEIELPTERSFAASAAATFAVEQRPPMAPSPLGKTTMDDDLSRVLDATFAGEDEVEAEAVAPGEVDDLDQALGLMPPVQAEPVEFESEAEEQAPEAAAVQDSSGEEPAADAPVAEEAEAVAPEMESVEVDNPAPAAEIVFSADDGAPGAVLPDAVEAADVPRDAVNAVAEQLADRVLQRVRKQLIEEIKSALKEM